MTTQSDIREWIGRAPKNSTHMIVVCDTFDHEDYPVFVLEDEDVMQKHSEYNGKNMQRVMEVYNLSLPIEPQIKQPRAFNL